MPDRPAVLLREWNLPAPSELRRPERGTNNAVFVLRAGESTYVLRIHLNADPDQVEAEQRLLRALADGGALSFDVPVALPTATGATYAASGRGPATLTRWIPGTHPARDIRGLELAGGALAELDAALATLPRELAPTDWSVRGLHQVHPRVPDLDALAADLTDALPDDLGARWFAERAPAIEAATTRCYAELPTQIIHGDYALGNLLVEGGEVRGVLDFEIAGIDLRITELVAALLQSTDDLAGEQIAAFRRGYDGRVRLTGDELRALPTLLRYRTLGSIVWRAGRWRAGHASLGEVADRLREGAAVDRLADELSDG